MRGSRDQAVPIQARDLAVIAIQREDPLQSLDLGRAKRNDALGCRLARMVEQQARRRSQRRAMPLIQSRGIRRSAVTAQQRQTRERPEDGDGAPSPQVAGTHRLAARTRVPAGLDGRPDCCSSNLRRHTIGGQVWSS